MLYHFNDVLLVISIYLNPHLGFSTFSMIIIYIFYSDISGLAGFVGTRTRFFFAVLGDQQCFGNTLDKIIFNVFGGPDVKGLISQQKTCN